MRFWDSSALIPLFVQQDPASETDTWIGEDPGVVAWTLTQVEVVSAFRRLVREQSLSEESARDAEALAEDLLERAYIVTDVERVKEEAYRLLRIHPLRAADALQLGAALAWASGPPRGLDFCTLDRRLGLAAEREGFRVLGA